MARVLTDRDTGDETPVVRDLGVLCWRQEELVRAGYPEDIAIRIAESRADLHVACELLANGATVHEAMRILI